MVDSSLDLPAVESADERPDPERFTPDSPPWSVLIGLAYWILSVLLIGLVPVFFLTPYLRWVGVKVTEQNEIEKAILADPNAVLIGLGGTLAAHVITIVVGWMIVTRLGKLGFREMLGWKWGGFRAWHAVVLFVAVYAAAAVLGALLGNQDNELLKILRSSRVAVFAVAAIATFSAPIVEEVVYRGVLYSSIKKSTSSSVAILVVTAVFAMVHVPQYWPDVATILSIILLSLILTLMRAMTGNILPCIVFHFLFNGVQSLLLILSPYFGEAYDPTRIGMLLK